MTFEEKIQAIVAQLTGTPTFIGGDWYKANVLTEKVDVPAVLYINPISGTWDIVANQAFDSPNCLIAFLDKVKFDDTFDNTTDVVNAMKLSALEFIKKANSSGYFYTIKDARYTVTYDRLDINLTGIILELTLKERQGSSLC